MSPGPPVGSLEVSASPSSPRFFPLLAPLTMLASRVARALRLSTFRASDVSESSLASSLAKSASSSVEGPSSSFFDSTTRSSCSGEEARGASWKLMSVKEY